MTLLARRYATALHLAARERGVVDLLEQQLGALHAAVAAPGVRALLLDPGVRAAERARVGAQLTAGSHELLQNLVQVLLRRRRQEVLFDLHEAYRALVLAERGEVEGVVETPRPLGDAEVERLRALAAEVSGKKVSFTVRVLPELIGGVRLFVGNVLYDGSVRTALEQLERRLLQAPIRV